MIRCFYIFVLLFLGCDSSLKDTPEKLWDQVKEYRSKKQLQNAITNCKKIISKYSNEDIAATALFQIGDIYLNDVKDFDFAIEYFKEVKEKYPNSKENEKASFMIGYIYANYLDSYSDAAISYNNFLDSYPESELIQSVKYELNILEPLLKTIDSLNTIVEKE